MKAQSQAFLPAVLVLAILVSVSCRKKNEPFALEIAGKVTDFSTGNGVAGATVTLQAQEITNNTWSSSYKTVTSTTSAADGSYSLGFDRVNAVDYEVSVSKKSYYAERENINPEKVIPDETYNASYSIKPEAWISVRVFNSNPVDATDELVYNLGQTFDCPNCCTGTTRKFTGNVIDSTIVCPLIGNSTVNLSWTVTKNGVVGSSVAAIACPSFDTTQFLITY